MGAEAFAERVEYHLSKVFSKLDIHSRVQLETVLPVVSAPVPRA
jgi:hypothetical protein